MQKVRSDTSETHRHYRESPNAGPYTLPCTFPVELAQFLFMRSPLAACVMGWSFVHSGRVKRGSHLCPPQDSEAHVRHDSAAWQLRCILADSEQACV